MREAEIDQERDAQGVRAYSGIYQDMLRERERQTQRVSSLRPLVA